MQWFQKVLGIQETDSSIPTVGDFKPPRNEKYAHSLSNLHNFFKHSRWKWKIKGNTPQPRVFLLFLRWNLMDLPFGVFQLLGKCSYNSHMNWSLKRPNNFWANFLWWTRNPKCMVFWTCYFSPLTTNLFGRFIDHTLVIWGMEWNGMEWGFLLYWWYWRFFLLMKLKSIDEHETSYWKTMKTIGLTI